jgi:hypothetical protein
MGDFYCETGKQSMEEQKTKKTEKAIYLEHNISIIASSFYNP